MSAQSRLLIALKSPIQKAVDPRPRCEECGSVLVQRDFDSYWDGGPPCGTPRICECCCENAEAGR